MVLMLIESVFFHTGIELQLSSGDTIKLYRIKGEGCFILPQNYDKNCIVSLCSFYFQD